MQTSVTFKNIESSPHLKSYIQEKMNRLEKLLIKPGKAEVVLRSEKLRKIAEINLNVPQLSINAREENTSLQAAIDLALDKVRTQIVKGKEKIQAHRN